MVIDDLDKFKQYPLDSLVYVVRRLNSECFFFTCDSRIIYAVVADDFPDEVCTPVKTDYLELFLNVELQPVDATNAAIDLKKYDFVQVELETTDREKIAFLNMCEEHARTHHDQGIGSFFNTLCLLFSSTEEKSKHKAIGLFGELSLIQVFHDRRIDISKRWQLNGVRTKYDFSFANANIEVKTTTKREQLVRLKHDQLFNGDHNYLALIHIEESPSGVSVDELAKRSKDDSICFQGMRERMVLERELLGIRDEDLRIPYSVIEFSLFESVDLNPFDDEVPQCVTRLEYTLNVLNVPTASIDYVAQSIQ